jgi:WD40 repeat protein
VVVYNRRGSLLATIGLDGVIRLWNTAPGSCTPRSRATSKTATPSPSTPRVMTSCQRLQEGTIRLWGLNEQRVHRTAGARDLAI